MSSGIIFDIQKFSIHDGPGIRSTVFFKGCPLRCVWCHNPESWNAKAEIFFDKSKCTLCGRCAIVCPSHAHGIKDGAHLFERKRCLSCAQCVEACHSGALELCGKERTPLEIIREVVKDKPFYENSGGGITFSGGEPMAQFSFLQEILHLAKEEGLHTAIETCGFAPWRDYEEIVPFVDLFLYDIKTIDAQKHKKFTGQYNARILENLWKLSDAGAAIFMRCPLVSGVNDSDEELSGIGKLAEEVAGVREVDVEPYHPLGISKAHRLGITDGFEAPFTSKEIWEGWIGRISDFTTKPVKKQ